jgi:hypothetical protein
VWCNETNRTLFRSTGGFVIHTSSPGTTGVELPGGSGTWSSFSDRNYKDNVELVDGREVLARLAEIPISTWNYTTEEESIRHMGPMAQDFYAAFGLGPDDRHITTIDADGVALAAIQALAGENAELRGRVDDLEAQMDELRALVTASAPAARPRGLDFLLSPDLLLVGPGLLLFGLGMVWVARRRGNGGG